MSKTISKITLMQTKVNLPSLRNEDSYLFLILLFVKSAIRGSVLNEVLS